MHVRDAVIGDVEAVARLVTELGYPTTVEQMQHRLARILSDPDYATFVADAGDRVIGVAGVALGRYYEKDGVYCHLVVLAVSAPMRGRGVGSALLHAVERWSIRAGGREVLVNSGLHRGGAHEFYQRCGYSRTGYRFVKPLDGATPAAGEPNAS